MSAILDKEIVSILKPPTIVVHFGFNGGVVLQQIVYDFSAKIAPASLYAIIFKLAFLPSQSFSCLGSASFLNLNSSFRLLFV